jgi:hypothetical protein
MKTDAFSLEQAIMECWQVCDDMNQEMDRQVLAKYYQMKFEKLWAIFEELTHDRYFTSSTSKTPLSTN